MAEQPTQVACASHTSQSAEQMLLTLDQVAPKLRLPGLKLSAKIGSGGMARVYRARQISLDREVAVKIGVTPGGQATNAKAVTPLEGRLLAALRHPNILQVYDAGVASDYQYIVMELVEGVSLRRLMASQDIEVEKVLWIMSCVCQGVLAAHKAGVCHGDIKPENILVGRGGQVKVADFGIAARRSKDMSCLNTNHGSSAATPLYAAPERRNGAPPDIASDIYSIGVIFYEMLTMRLPAERHTHPIQYNTECPAWIDDVVARCLQPETRKRFANVAKLLEVIDNAKRNEADRDVREQVQAQTREILAAITGTRLTATAFMLRRLFSRGLGLLAAGCFISILFYPLYGDYANVFEWQEALRGEGTRIPIATVIVGCAGAALYTSALQNDEVRGLLQAFLSGATMVLGACMILSYFSTSHRAVPSEQWRIGLLINLAAAVWLTLGCLISPSPGFLARVMTLVVVMSIAVGLVIALPKLLLQQ